MLPLGHAGRWITDASGNETGYMGLNATLRDWGRRFGQAGLTTRAG